MKRNTKQGQSGFWLVVLGMIASGLIGTQQRANAFPAFARKYNLPCARCHSMVPRLTPFGYAFYRAGFRLPSNERKPLNLLHMLDALTEIDLQKASGGPDITLSEVILPVTIPIGDSVTFHTLYIQTNTHDMPSSFDELWAQYNSKTKGNYFSVRAGQIPTISGYQFLGARSITITDPMLFGSNGPLTGDGQGNFAIANLERGVELGYTTGTFYNRLSWFQGVDESGNGATGISHNGWNDFGFQSEYLIGREGNAIQGMYYNGRQRLESMGFDNNFQRAGIFGTVGKNYRVRELGIPDYRWELNGGALWGQDRTSAAGKNETSWGAVLEADAYYRYQTAFAARFDTVRPSTVAGTPVTQAWTLALQHRFSPLVQTGVEYRHQTGPLFDSWIGAVKLTF